MRHATFVIILMLISGIVAVSWFIFATNKGEHAAQEEWNPEFSIKCKALNGISKDYAHTLDIVLVPAESYSNDMEDFLKDSLHNIDKFLSVDPFSKYKDAINFFYVETPINFLSSRSRDIINVLDNECGDWDIAVNLKSTSGGTVISAPDIEPHIGFVLTDAHYPLTFIHEMSHILGFADESYGGGLPNCCKDMSCCGGKLCQSEIIGLSKNDFSQREPVEDGGERDCCLISDPQLPEKARWYTTNEKCVMKADMRYEDYKFDSYDRPIMGNILKDIKNNGILYKEKREQLYKIYWIYNESISDIMRQYDMDESTVIGLLDKYEIPLKT